MMGHFSRRAAKRAEAGKSSHWMAFCLIVLAFLWISGCSRQTAQRITLDFNNDWVFMKGEQDEQVIQMDFDDSGWQTLKTYSAP